MKYQGKDLWIAMGFTVGSSFVGVVAGFGIAALGFTAGPVLIGGTVVAIAVEALAECAKKAYLHPVGGN